MAVTDHQFGSVSTDLKLSVVESYLSAFTTALRPNFTELWYIDAFAGTGERTVVVPGRAADMLGPGVEDRIDRRRGSAKIAIDVVPHFDRLIFMEKRPRHCDALLELKAAHPTRSIDVIPGDANAAIAAFIRRHNWSGTRAVMFLDPYGMTVEWAHLGSD